MLIVFTSFAKKAFHCISMKYLENQVHILINPQLMLHSNTYKNALMRGRKIKGLYMRPNMLAVTTNNWNNAANAWGQSKSAF